MKKTLHVALIVTLIIALFSGYTFAAEFKVQNSGQNWSRDWNKDGKSDEYSVEKEKKTSFKISGSPVITYGRFKLPLSPIENGMGAAVTYTAGVIKITKGSVIIEIDLYNKKVFVTKDNLRVEDTNSGIFTASNKNRMTVLIKYIASKLGVRTNVNGDKIDVTIPTIPLPTSITVTPYGGNVVANTLNTTTLYLTGQANITAGQATGGRAELYVGSTLVATDSQIASGDTSVTFTVSGVTPTNAELQQLIPAGGKVAVRLYNVTGGYVTSKTGPTLTVDYSAPIITSITAAIYSPAENKIHLYINGTVQKGDVLDVTKVTIIDTDATPTTINRALVTGSKGVVVNSNEITITLGAEDISKLTGLGGTNASVTLAGINIITDAAGNSFPLTIPSTFTASLITQY